MPNSGMNRFIYMGEPVSMLDRETCKCEHCGDPVWIRFRNMPNQKQRVQRSELIPIKESENN